jgi:heme-degrading monooxygenase HmoA
MIRVIIEREIAEGLEEFYETAIANLLDVMTNAHGYVSGESSVEIHRPNRYVVITRWTDEAAWNRWYQSSERQELLTAGAVKCYSTIPAQGRKVYAAETAELTPGQVGQVEYLTSVHGLCGINN